MGHDKAGSLVLVVDEAQKLANKHVLADGILNVFCKASPYGPVIMISSEYNVPQFLKMMTHILSRTKVIFAKTATKEEMLPFVRAFFGDQAAQKVVDACDGAFQLLLELMDKADVDAGLSQVRDDYKMDIVHKLELHQDIMSADRAKRTHKAMVAAAQLAFSEELIDPFKDGALELAQAGAAKIEGQGSSTSTAWAAPMTNDIMKEVLCHRAYHTTIMKSVEDSLYKEFEEVIEGRCPAQGMK